MKKVVICGLGAVGLTYAVKFYSSKAAELKILADEVRIKKFKTQKPVFNGEEYNFDYISPQDKYEADLIIIATKIQGLNKAISYINNCVQPQTKILSLINGISSEDIIKKAYPNNKVIKSYFIGHSAVRDGNRVTQDGVGKIVMGEDKELEEFLSACEICYEIPEDIEYSMWLKYTFNLFSNQTSAILKMSFGEMRKNTEFINFAKKIIQEVKLIAEKSGVKNLQNLEQDGLKSLELMCEDGKTSMLQDILAKKETEVDMFGGEIIRLGKLYGIPTPYNQVLYDLIKIEEKHNELSIHSC